MLTRPFLVAIPAGLLIAGILSAERPWQVVLLGEDVTASAEVRERAGHAEVNLAALAQRMNLRLSVEGASMTVTNSSGRAWKGQAGALELEGNPGLLEIGSALRIEGTAVYLPVETVAAIADLEISINRTERRVQLGGTPKQQIKPRENATAPALIPGSVSAPAGWDTFQIEKTEEEKRETARVAGMPVAESGKGQAPGAAHPALKQPDASDVMRVSTTSGFVVGADGGMEVMGSGRFSGYDVDVSATPTLGPKGAGILSGRLAFGDKQAGWQVQGGDLYSETWGLARGLRYNRNSGSRNLASASLYLQSKRDGTDKPVVSLADQLNLTKQVRLSGELNSEGSYFGRTSLHIGNFAGDAFYRDAKMRNGNSAGFSAGYAFRRLGAYANWTSSGRGPDRILLKGAALRLPLFRRTDLTLEQTRNETALYRMRINSANLTVPVHPIRINLRYQQRDTYRPDQDGAWMRSPRLNQWTTMLSYRPSRRLAVDEQVVTTWSVGARRETWDQFTIACWPAKKLEFQWTGSLADPSNIQRMRTRMQWWIEDGFAFIVEYGNVSPYQSMTHPWLRTPEGMFRIAIRKDWNMRTPARGGEVNGKVTDSSGHTLSAVVVDVGPYSVETDENGEYRLKRLPRGEYSVRLRQETIPAQVYSQADEPVTFESYRRGAESFDFVLLNFQSVGGRVCMDDGNGRPDHSKGIPSVTLMLGEQATSTQPDGTFGFYNLKAGTYKVRLDPLTLPKDLELVSSEERQVRVRPEPGASTPELEFVVRKKAEKIIFIDETESQ